MSLAVYYSADPSPTLSPRQIPSGIPCRLEYLNEGGANFVFRIVGSGEGVDERLPDKLLRLRKALPHVQSAADQLQAYDGNFKDLFPQEHLIQHDLVKLEGNLPSYMNQMLPYIDRPSHRQHDRLPTDETQGMLVTDMTPSFNETLLQIKPKWLAQSPTAPKGAKRCRTCALRAQRASQDIRTATDKQQSCPLDLISGERARREETVSSISDDAQLQQYLVGDAQPLLETLRGQQTSLDPRGILQATTNEEILDVCRAMTLRDCTFFLRRSGDGIEARLGDLDLKQPEKAGRWREVEESLIDGGWYANTEAEACRKPETTCALSYA